mmetsp:Transcript_83810/g.242363  ORF Transcript_83810/g.242363 Transcript_83810/m.242363 type:complete len:191 (-) Transcript_83810:199-771(-)
MLACCEVGPPAQMLQAEVLADLRRGVSSLSAVTALRHNDPSAQSRQEKHSREKLRLKGLAKDFFAKAAHGIHLEMVDVHVGRARTVSLRLDPGFRHLFLSWGGTVQFVLQVADLRTPCCGRSLPAGLPGVSDPSRFVLVETITDGLRFLFSFASTGEADDFCKCLAILRLALVLPVDGLFVAHGVRTHNL